MCCKEDQLTVHGRVKKSELFHFTCGVSSAWNGDSSETAVTFSVVVTLDVENDELYLSIISWRYCNVNLFSVRYRQPIPVRKKHSTEKIQQESFWPATKDTGLYRNFPVHLLLLVNVWILIIFFSSLSLLLTGLYAQLLLLIWGPLLCLYPVSILSRSDGFLYVCFFFFFHLWHPWQRHFFDFLLFLLRGWRHSDSVR